MDSIVARLRSNRKDALAELYETYRTEFLRWIMRYRCSTDEAKDAYQFAVLTFYENIVSGKLTLLNSSEKTYLFAIGKNKIMEMRRATGKLSELNEQEENLPDVSFEEEQVDPNHLKRVAWCLEKLGEPCVSLLKEFYYHCRSMEEIAKLLDYKNTDSAKNQKYKCLLRLRKLFNETTLTVNG